MVKKENKKIIITLSSIIVILAITSIVSISYNFLGGFYYGRIVKYNAMLGENLNVVVDGEGAYTISCNFSGSLVLDQNFKQEVSLEVKKVNDPIYVRAKAYISGSNQNVKMSGVTNWILAEDGYYYFNQSINSLEKIQLCNNLIFDLDMDLNSYKDYILTFLIESSVNGWEYEII